MAYTLWVTSNCNLKCTYCYEGKNKAILAMSKLVIDKSVDFIFDNLKEEQKELVISIHGGEPFLEFDQIKYIINTFKCKFKNIKTKVNFITTTNATLLNEDIISYIVKEIPDITLSLDGKKETHDYARKFKDGTGSFDCAMKNSLRLLKDLPNLRVRMTFDSKTVSSLNDNVQYLFSLGFRFIVPAPNLFDNNWDENTNTIYKDQLNLMNINCQSKNITVSLIDKEKYKYKTPCTGGINSFHIYPDGNLYPCIFSANHKEFQIGSIFSGIDTKKVNKISDVSKEDNKDCLGCVLYNFCDGPRCKIINKLLTGNYNTATGIHCASERVQYEVKKVLYNKACNTTLHITK